MAVNKPCWHCKHSGFDTGTERLYCVHPKVVDEDPNGGKPFLAYCRQARSMFERFLLRGEAANPAELEILGREPGTHKAYVHINDTLRAILLAWSKIGEGVSVFNVGTEDTITVRDVADAVCGAMGLRDVAYRWSGGIDGGGWKGDVRRMALRVDRLRDLGWRPRYASAEAVALAAKELAR